MVGYEWDFPAIGVGSPLIIFPILQTFCNIRRKENKL